MPKCKNCDYEVDNNFCPQCGQNTSIKRFTTRSLVHEFIHGFYHVDHGILYTIKALTIHPGKMIKDYLHGKRKSSFNPFTFVMVVSALLAVLLPRLIQQSLFAEFGLVDQQTINTDLVKSSFEHISVRLILGLPLFALVSYIFYRKKQFNFSENLIINTYLRGQSSLFVLLLLPLIVVNPSHNMMILFSAGYFFITAAYYGWAYCDTFENKTSLTGILKGFACALLAHLSELSIVNLLWVAIR